MGETDPWSSCQRSGQLDQDPAQNLRDLTDDPAGRDLRRLGRDGQE